MTAKVIFVDVIALSDDEATATVTSEQTRRVVDPASGALTAARFVRSPDPAGLAAYWATSALCSAGRARKRSWAYRVRVNSLPQYLRQRYRCSFV